MFAACIFFLFLFLLILVVSFLFVLRLYHLRSDKLKRNKSKGRLLPGPVPWPLIGNLPEIYFNRPSFRWVTGVMREMKTDIACIKLGSVHVIPVSCPEMAREFLKKHDAIFASRPLTMVTEITSRGYLSLVMTPLGDQSKKMRRFMASHILTTARIRWLHDKRLEESDHLVRYLYNLCCNMSSFSLLVNVREVGRQYCCNVIWKMLFNKRYLMEKRRENGGPGKEEKEYIDAIFAVLSLFYAFAVSDYMPCLRSLDLDGQTKTLKKAVNTINKYHDPVIDQRVKEWKIGRKSVVEDLLDVFISTHVDGDGKPLLSTEEIKAQACELVLAAIDNPSNAAEWAIAEMLNQPDVLCKAVEEIDRVVGKERMVQETDLPQLNYVKACCREAFRLHPIAPFNVPHVSTRDAIVAGYFIPKGSHVILSRKGLGTNPKVWDDPLKFKPERHMGTSNTCTEMVDMAEHQLRFITFTTGRRGCMGSHLGTLTTVMLLARLLHAFTWTLPGGVSKIDLSESPNDLFLNAPLLAHAKPRLPPHLYAALCGSLAA